MDEYKETVSGGDNRSDVPMNSDTAAACTRMHKFKGKQCRSGGGDPGFPSLIKKLSAIGTCLQKKNVLLQLGTLTTLQGRPNAQE